MTTVHWLTDKSADVAEGPPAPPPQPFVRLLSTPPGLPWEQARAAALEAKVGAPLPISQLRYQLRRVSPWRNGKAASFAAVYVRSDAVKDRFEARVDAGGTPLTIVFLSRREQARRTRMLAAIAGAFAVGVFAAVTGTSLALAERAESGERLARLEQMTQQRKGRVAAATRLAIENRALAAENVDGRRVADFLDDLAWASQAKANGARIRAVHWQDGYLAVEAKGTEPPFTDGRRQARMFDKPVREGVFLWAVAPEGSR